MKRGKVLTLILFGMIKFYFANRSVY